MNERSQHIFNRETLIPVGFVISIAGMSFWLGITFSRVNKLDTTVSQQSETIQYLRERAAAQEQTNFQVLDALKDIKSDVNAIRDQQSKGKP